MRPTTIALLATTALAPLASTLAAQGTPGAMPGMAMGSDPTKKIVSSGQLPSGWMLRFDPIIPRPNRPVPPTPTMTDVEFITMGGGLHARTGPAAIYYRSADMASGQYTVNATFAQSKSMQHEAYGIFMGGSDLQDSTQSYTYFVVRPMDGAALITHRAGNARPTALLPWTPNDAVNKEDATDGHATNQLAIRVGRDSVSFMANGKTVRTMAKSELGGAATDGAFGLRVNHNLDVHISEFGMSAMGTKVKK